ncbi:MAG: glycerol-3-phosphate 1-O-acyltransferase [Kangiella sp.]|nr:MAG: glycerol-3-phosphate 1-O-acyltransferase [Kangiella sp.]
MILNIYQKLVGIPLKLLVNSKLLPEDPIKDLEIDLEQPIYYVLQRNSTSSFLMLREKARALGLPEPKIIPKKSNKIENGSVFFLQSKMILGLGGSPIQRYQKSLFQLLEQQRSDIETKHQLLPLSIYWGRNPGKENSFFRVIFTDTESASFIRKFFLFIFQGRNTFIRLTKPVDLRRVALSETKHEVQVRKLTRTLRVHFHRLRQVAMGPLVSNRGQMVTNLIVSDTVREAINREMKKKKLTKSKATKLAKKYALEISSAYSYKAVRFMESMLTHLWNKIYNGVVVQNAELVREISSTHQVVYVPSHRSHIDYLLLSYTLYHEGLVPPHIAAGINLNFWPAGPLLRRGGAFFLRRSFGGNKLYTAVFNEYIYQLMNRGTPLEFFPEGGRSRTGRLLQPKTGLLAMTVQALLRGTRKPVAIIPVYIGYERMFEGNSYLKELRGGEKKKESFGQLLGIRKTLKQNFGKVYLNFSPPIDLNKYLDQHEPDWKDYRGQVGAKPSWLTPRVSSLSELIMQRINGTSRVNSISLVALVLLSSERTAVGKKELAIQLDILLSLMKSVPYSNCTMVPTESGQALIEQAKDLGTIFEVKNPMGDIITTTEETAVLMTYYRNNIIHIFIAFSLVASCFVNHKRVALSTLVKRCLQFYPFLKRELFIHWSSEDFEIQIEKTVESFIELKLLSKSDTHIIRPNELCDELDQLLLMAEIIKPILLRYGILLTLLSSQAGKSISRRELEQHSQEVAQRLAALYSINAPESFDKDLFKTTTSVLRKTGLIKIADDNSFEVSDELIKLNAQVLGNVSVNSKRIMQKTADWAKQHWNKE